MRSSQVLQVGLCVGIVFWFSENVHGGEGGPWFIDDFCDSWAVDAGWDRALIMDDPDGLVWGAGRALFAITGEGFEISYAAGETQPGVVSGTGPELDVWTPFLHDDVSIRTEIRRRGSGDGEKLNLGVFARLQRFGFPPYSDYAAGLNPSAGGVYLGKIVDDVYTRHDFHSVGQFDIYSEDMVLQLDVVGGELVLWAWPAGSSKIQGWTCEWYDPHPLPIGGVGFHSWTGDDGSDVAIFRYVMVFPPGQEPFQRGDANADGGTDLSDAVYIWDYLFLGGEEPVCLDGADANDSGQLDLSDGVYLLSFLFRGGPKPPAPHSTCGVDPTPADGLSGSRYEPWESYERCVMSNEG